MALGQGCISTCERPGRCTGTADAGMHGVASGVIRPRAGNMVVRVLEVVTCTTRSQEAQVIRLGVAHCIDVGCTINMCIGMLAI